MTPDELAERKARQEARDKVWLREHRPHLVATVGLVCLAVAGVTGAGSSSVGDTPQTYGAEILLIFSAIPRLLIGTDGAVALFAGLGAVCLIAAGVMWVRLRLEKSAKHPRTRSTRPPAE